MSSDAVISVKNLTKTYRIFGHPGDRIKQALTFGRMRFHREFTALKDVSFEIRKGETVGIIGRNGSGKSTLLQLVCGILKPTSGLLQVNGRVSALLELGAGFNPEFTGRENVYFQGALIGFTSSEMDKRFDDIAAFADIGEFIDQPVRIYSSGMFVRLAFSVAVSVEPDILVVDEALAVGDAAYQAKCFRKMEALRSAGKSILMVSHSAEQLARLCDSAILLDKGHLVTSGETSQVAREYLSRLYEVAEIPTNPFPDVSDSIASPIAEKFHTRLGYNSAEHRFGSQEARIVDFCLSSDGVPCVSTVQSQGRLKVELRIIFLRDVGSPIYGITIKTKDGVTLFGTNTQENTLSNCNVREQKAGSVVWVSFEMTPHLCVGSYFISVAVAASMEGNLVHLDRRNDSILIEIAAPPTLTGMINMQPFFAYSEHPND